MISWPSNFCKPFTIFFIVSSLVLISSWYFCVYSICSISILSLISWISFRCFTAILDRAIRFYSSKDISFFSYSFLICKLVSYSCYFLNFNSIFSCSILFKSYLYLPYILISFWWFCSLLLAFYALFSLYIYNLCSSWRILLVSSWLRCWWVFTLWL